MLRKGIVALMMTLAGVHSIHAADGPTSGGLLKELFRGPSIRMPARRTAPSRTSGGVAHAVVSDAEKQVPEIRQVSKRPEKPALQRANAVPQPTPLPYAATEQTVRPVNGGQPAAQRSYVPAQPVMYSGPVPVMTQGAVAAPTVFVSSGVPGHGGHVMHGPVYGGPAMAPHGSAYGQSAGALYPAPRPNIPAYVGGTLIPNPAFHPHEMMYPHRYKAMYGPFYHKVHGKWIVTPFGVWSKENWKLMGTTVDVQYKKDISPFALFHPPVLP